MNKPKVSVLMPVYNGEKFLRKAIDSILRQTFTDFEFLIINDASTDNSKEIILSYNDKRIKYFENEKNLGVAKTLNKGMKLAKGKYIARMDADDISFPERLKEQVNYLDNHSYCDVVVTKIYIMDICGNVLGKWKEDQENITFRQIKKQLPISNCLAHPTVMVKSSILRQYGYCGNLRHSSDYELWLRLCSDERRIEKIDEELVYYRTRPDSITSITLKRGSSYKNIQTKVQFIFGRTKRLKTRYFEIKTSLYLLKDVFSFGFTNLRKNIIDVLKEPLINIGITIGRIIPSINPSGIFFIFLFYHIGGAEKVHADIVNCIKTEKKPLIIFTNHSNNKSLKYLFERNGHVLDLSPLLFLKITRYLMAGILISQINKCPRAVTFSSNNLLYYEILKYLKPNVLKIDLTHIFEGGIEYQSLSYINKIDYRVVINDKTKSDICCLYKYHGFDKELINKIVVIENKVDIPKTIPQKKHSNILKFVYVGRWSEEKRVYLILESAKLCFEKKIPADFTIIGDIPTSIKNQYRKYCFFTGEIKSFDTMKKYYKKADFILITSMREGFPLVVMETMAYGVIPISTNVGNIPFHIKSWQNGIIIEDKTESDIVKKILEIIDKVNKKRSLINKISQNARRYAVKHFHSKFFCYKYNQLMQKVFQE